MICLSTGRLAQAPFCVALHCSLWGIRGNLFHPKAKELNSPTTERRKGVGSAPQARRASAPSPLSDPVADPLTDGPSRRAIAPLHGESHGLPPQARRGHKGKRRPKGYTWLHEEAGRRVSWDPGRGILGPLWLLGFPSVPWALRNGPLRLAALRIRALGELHENRCERVPFGEACRYDGRSKPCARVQELTADGHELVPVCPEEKRVCQAAYPRRVPPAKSYRLHGWEWESAHGGRARLDDRSTRAWGSRSHGRLRPRRAGRACTCEGKRAVSWPSSRRSSPSSCGSGEVYDGTFSGTLVPGWGIAAATFRDAGITVIDETADFSRLANG